MPKEIIHKFTARFTLRPFDRALLMNRNLPKVIIQISRTLVFKVVLIRVTVPKLVSVKTVRCLLRHAKAFNTLVLKDTSTK